MGSKATLTVAVIVTASALVACSDSSRGAPDTRDAAYQPPSTEGPQTPASPRSSAPQGHADGSRAEALVSDGSPRDATLTVPSLGLHDIAVVPYVGKTDDARGTRIQDRGLAASPYGPRGGVGPGGVGNYQVTAHRLSSTQVFLELPSLRPGQRALVDAGGVRYVYEIRNTRTTSFLSPTSLAEQRAAVPGRPRVPASRAFLTLSTCATPEDHARGNFYADRFGNPEHRIDKIGVLVRSEPLD